LITLSVTDDSEQYTVLAREVQRHPTKSQVLHVDFYRVLMSETMQATVPVVIVGTSPAVINNMAALVQSLDSIQVECLPGDLPDAFEVDISILERTDQNILLSDLVVPEGVTILDDTETVLFSLAAARALEEEEEEEEELLYGAPEEEEVEVMAKGKAASEDEEWEEEA
jgi:large subunit ribosomal protein L25